MRRRDKDLQADLILGPAFAGPSDSPSVAVAAAPLVAPSVPSTPVTEPTAPAKPRATTQRTKARMQAAGSSLDRAMTAVAYCGVILLAGLLWYIGAFYTLTFCRTVIPAVERLDLFMWGIPLIITAIELKMWPKPTSSKLLWAVFVGILIFDIGSSYSGFTTWAGGRTIPLFNGFTFPESGAVLSLTGIVLGVVFAFAPERMARAAARELMDLWQHAS